MSIRSRTGLENVVIRSWCTFMQRSLQSSWHSTWKKLKRGEIWQELGYSELSMLDVALSSLIYFVSSLLVFVVEFQFQNVGTTL